MSENLKGLYIKDKNTEYIVNDSVEVESISILTTEYIREHIEEFISCDRLTIGNLIYYKMDNKFIQGETEGYVLLPAILPFIFEAHNQGKLVYINFDTTGKGKYIFISKDTFELESGEFEGGTKVIPNVPLDGTEPILESLDVDGEKFKVDRGNKVTPNIEDIDVEELQRLTNVKIEDQTFSTSPRFFKLIDYSCTFPYLSLDLLNKVNIGDVIYGSYETSEYPLTYFILTTVVKSPEYVEFRGNDYETNSLGAILKYTSNGERYVFDSFDIEEKEVVEPINTDICASPSVKYNYYYDVEPFGINFPNGVSIQDKRDVWTVGGTLYYSNQHTTYKYNKNKYEWTAQSSDSISGRNYFTYENNTYYLYNGNCYIVDSNGNRTSIDKFNTVNGSGTYVFSGFNVWTDGTDLYYSSQNGGNRQGEYHQLVYDKLNDTWVPKTWNGTNPYAMNIWSDGENIYYSTTTYNTNYILDKKTSTWNRIEFSKTIYPIYIWSDGENVFYSDSSNQYLFDKDNKKWITLPSVMIRGETLFTDGDDIFCMNGNGTNSTYKLVKCYTNTNAKPSMKGTSSDREFVPNIGLKIEDRNRLNVNVGSFMHINSNNALCSEPLATRHVTVGGSIAYPRVIMEPMTFNGYTDIQGMYVWTDGTNIYYSNGSKQYVLDRDTNTWNLKEWSGLTSFSGSEIWTDGVNIFYSSGYNHYQLNGSTWITKTWRGLTYFYGSYVWTDGTKMYYSDGNTQYETTSTYSGQWEKVTWYLDTYYTFEFSGISVWTDGCEIYCVKSGTLYNMDTSNHAVKRLTSMSTISNHRNIINIDGYTYYFSSNRIYVWDKVDLTFRSFITSSSLVYSDGIWTDGNNIYYSSVSGGVGSHYKIDLIRISSHCKSLDIRNTTPRANPTLDGTEPFLTGIQFGNNKFRVLQGTIVPSPTWLTVMLYDTSAAGNVRIIFDIAATNPDYLLNATDFDDFVTKLVGNDDNIDFPASGYYNNKTVWAIDTYDDDGAYTINVHTTDGGIDYIYNSTTGMNYTITRKKITF